MIVDLFAGPGGWSEALRELGHHHHEIGIEWDRHACATRAAAGHRATIRADVAAVPTEPFAGRVSGLIASPPCQTFSNAGKKDGRDHLEKLIDHAHRGELYATPDPRTGLVLEPLRWIHALAPRWIALEQVTAVLPVWHAYEHHLRELGYYTWSGVMNAANYGVPQTRKRAILIASLDHPVSRPHPTHEKNPDGLFGLAPWISSCEALGLSGDLELVERRGAGLTERSGPRAPHPMALPWPTVTGGENRRRFIIDRRQTGAPPLSSEVPAPTIVGSAIGEGVWKIRSVGVSRAPTVAEVATIQSFRPDYPFAGPQQSQHLQAGNAIPPGLARAVLAEVLR